MLRFRLFCEGGAVIAVCCYLRHRQTQTDTGDTRRRRPAIDGWMDDRLMTDRQTSQAACLSLKLESLVSTSEILLLFSFRLSQEPVTNDSSASRRSKGPLGYWAGQGN